MGSIVERYDRDAEDYERYWAPVLDASARGLLDRVADVAAGMTGTGPRVVDIGTGSGVLALEAHRRWPTAVVTGVDPSQGMLGMAARRVRAAGIPDADTTLRWAVGSADSLPLADASVDLALSSFVLQLVPDRAAALREAHRILRPGGCLALITWLDDEREFLPSVEFDEAVVDLGIPEPGEDDEEDCAGDFASVDAAVDELRAAGFEAPVAREEMLRYAWTAASYLDFKEHYDEAWLFELLAGTPHAERLRELARARFAALPADAFVWQTPLVSVVARRPA